jgi:hypothetical protein
VIPLPRCPIPDQCELVGCQRPTVCTAPPPLTPPPLPEALGWFSRAVGTLAERLDCLKAPPPREPELHEQIAAILAAADAAPLPTIELVPEMLVSETRPIAPPPPPAAAPSRPAAPLRPTELHVHSVPGFGAGVGRGYILAVGPNALASARTPEELGEVVAEWGRQWEMGS